MSKHSDFRPSRLQKWLAWGVHLYTALGLVAAAIIAVLIVEGGAESFRWAFVVMFAATFIDATDGTLARAVRIKEVLPGFDGRRLDDIIDFQTYTSLPLLLLWRAGVLPAGAEWCLVLAALASIYGFCQVEAKTADGYFLGFPSYWNLVVFYLYVLQPPAAVSIAIIVGLSVLTFVPLRYLYPSQGGKLNLVTNVLGAVWGIALTWLLFAMPGSANSGQPAGNLAWLARWSLLFPAYYMLVSWWVSFSVWRQRRRQA